MCGMDPRARAVIDGVRAILQRYTAHRVSLVAGGMAFFVALSLAPAALAIGRLAGLLLDPAQVRTVMETIARQSPHVGPSSDVSDAVISLVESGSAASVTITTLVSLALAVYAASRVVLGMHLALNTALGRPERFQGIGRRVFATAMTLVGLIAIAGALIVLTVLPAIFAWLGVDISLSTGLPVLDWLVFSLALWFGIRELLGRPAGLGRWPAFEPVLATGWVLAVSGGVGVYVNVSSSMSATAVLFGSAIVVLLWLYLCFVGILLAAEVIGYRAESTRE